MRSNLIRMGSLAVAAALALCLAGCAKADEQTQAVIDRIDAIGEVTIDSKADIESIRKDYDDLTDAQKKHVENLDTLEAAESSLSPLKVNQCIALIDGIGEVTLKREGAVDVAYDCFNGLTLEERELVTNKATLDEAKKTIETLEAEAKAQEKASQKATSSSSSSSSKSSTSSSVKSSSSKSSSSSKKETGSYYDPKTGGTLYTYSDGTEEYTDGWGNAVRGRNGKAEEYTTDGGKTWRKYKD